MGALAARLPDRDAKFAVSMYKRSLGLDPNRPLTQESCGVALVVVGQYEESQHHLERALALGRDTAALRSAFGAVKFSMGRLKEAEEHLLRAVELAPSDADAAENLKHVKAARAQRKAEQAARKKRKQSR
mmetsp:Transcript_28814/g.43620  ORF Transcript_28814/g.43620 Transcript_28814/m.43620 type:complete len:130 (+) Transcript_28814:3-392(+)